MLCRPGDGAEHTTPQPLDIRGILRLRGVGDPGSSIYTDSVQVGAGRRGFMDPLSPYSKAERVLWAHFTEKRTEALSAGWGLGDLPRVTG